MNKIYLFFLILLSCSFKEGGLKITKEKASIKDEKVQNVELNVFKNELFQINYPKSYVDKSSEDLFLATDNANKSIISFFKDDGQDLDSFTNKSSKSLAKKKVIIDYIIHSNFLNYPAFMIVGNKNGWSIFVWSVVVRSSGYIFYCSSVLDQTATINICEPIKNTITLK